MTEPLASAAIRYRLLLKSLYIYLSAAEKPHFTNQSHHGPYSKDQGEGSPNPTGQSSLSKLPPCHVEGTKSSPHYGGIAPQKTKHQSRGSKEEYEGRYDGGKQPLPRQSATRSANDRTPTRGAQGRTDRIIWEWQNRCSRQLLTTKDKT